MRILFFASISLSLFIWGACSSPTQKPDVAALPPQHLFCDSSMQTIYEAVYVDSGVDENWARHTNVKYRMAFAQSLMAFGQPKHWEQLKPLLEDPNPLVRRLAGKAAGTVADGSKAFQLIERLAQEQDGPAWCFLAESLGKVGDSSHIDFLLQGEHPENHHQHWLEGQSRALYQLGKRGISRQEGTRLLVAILFESDLKEARFYAAQYLARTRNLDLKDHRETLENVFKSADKDLQMALVLALAKADAGAIIASIAQNNPEPLVRVNAFRSLSRFSYTIASEAAFVGLKDQDHQVRQTAANYFRRNGLAKDAKVYAKAAFEAPDWQDQALLFAASLKYTSSPDSIRQELLKRFEKESNPYAKAAWVEALSEDRSQLSFLEKVLFEEDQPAVVRTAAINGMDHLLTLWATGPFDKSYPIPLQRLASTLQKAIASNDVAVTGLAANLLTNTNLDFPSVIKDYGFIETAIASCKIPRDVEAFQALSKAHERFAGLPGAMEQPFPNPLALDWNFIAQLPQQPKAMIHTTKGDITIELYLEKTPATVANFLRLAEEKAFDQRFIHRMVPNFVAQGGCPRGDGWGAPDYAIRTEGVVEFGAFSLGMASAGRDTEGVQWFITHSATPHLNGTYTCFGKAIAGLDVVQALQVGDEIVGVELL